MKLLLLIKLCWIWLNVPTSNTKWVIYIVSFIWTSFILREDHGLEQTFERTHTSARKLRSYKNTRLGTSSRLSWCVEQGPCLICVEDSVHSANNRATTWNMRLRPANRRRWKPPLMARGVLLVGGTPSYTHNQTLLCTTTTTMTCLQSRYSDTLSLRGRKYQTYSYERTHTSARKLRSYKNTRVGTSTNTTTKTSGNAIYCFLGKCELLKRYNDIVFAVWPLGQRHCLHRVTGTQQLHCIDFIAARTPVGHHHGSNGLNPRRMYISGKLATS